MGRDPSDAVPGTEEGPARRCKMHGELSYGGVCCGVSTLEVRRGRNGRRTYRMNRITRIKVSGSWTAGARRPFPFAPQNTIV